MESNGLSFIAKSIIAGGSTYRQFQRTEDFPPPPPQTIYTEDHSFPPPPPPDTGRGYQEEDFPPPPQSSGYDGRDVTSPIHVTTEYNQSSYSSQGQSYGGNQFSPSSGGFQSAQRSEYRTESPIENTFQSDERHRRYSGNSPSNQQKSNYANLESIQSAYTGSSPAPQEPPIYAKPNIRSADVYNR